VIRRPLIKLRETPAAELRLVWLPYAGGSAAAFQALSDLLPPSIEPFAMEYPGRGRRRTERLQHNLLALAAEVADACRDLRDRPFVFFGHSMGAVVALEACRRMRLAYAPLPSLVIVSAHEPPHLPSPSPDLHTMPTDELLDALRTFGGTPSELLDQRELMELVLPVLRADFTACERHTASAWPKIGIDLAVYGGAADAEVPVGSLQHWQDLTSGAAQVRVFEGGHFYFQQHPDAVMTAIAADVRRSIQVANA
jgi:medium-chain acyl-[acyl-carrier-protein] hydrolase